MTFWIILWKLVFIVTILLFAAMALWVTIGGWIDLKQMLTDLQRQEPDEDETGIDPPSNRG